MGGKQVVLDKQVAAWTDLTQGQNRKQIDFSPNSWVKDDTWKGGDTVGVCFCGGGMWSDWGWHCKQGKMTGLAVADDRHSTDFFSTSWSKTGACSQVMKEQWKVQWTGTCKGPRPGFPLPSLGLHSSLLHCYFLVLWDHSSPQTDILWCGRQPPRWPLISLVFWYSYPLLAPSPKLATLSWLDLVTRL